MTGGHDGFASGVEARPGLVPTSMTRAVGYPRIECAHQVLIDDYLVAKHDRCFLLVDEHGDILPAGHCGLGLFHDDTRMVSQYALTFRGGPASLLSSRATSMYGLQVDLAIGDRDFGGDSWDPKNIIHVRREILLSDHMEERLTLTSFLPRALDFWAELEVGCDFADIFEVRGWKRDERGQFYEPVAGEGSLCFAYRGRDGRLLRSRVRFSGPPAEVRAGRARWAMVLEPGRPHVIEWAIVPETDGGEDDDAGATPAALDRGVVARAYDEWRAECARWTTDVEQFNGALERAAVDLRGLYTEIDGEEVITAGIPWYSTVFGRDSIITSLQALTLSPRMARDTLRYLARHQGAKEDPYTEEQPGKILHELRRGELARSGEIPHVPYYGTIDATPLWLILLHETWRWTGDEGLVRELLPNAERALAWIDRYGDIDGDGLVEYARTSEKGLVNQGWKDSGDGVPFPDGTLPDPPIALVEVQGYVHDAKLRMAQLYRVLGDEGRADRLRDEADRLRALIQDRFWLDELGTFALALDGEKRPLATSTTNAGHLLWSRVPTPEQAASMARVLMGDDMFSGWGIRTLSAAHPVYNPMSYHNGSVWPHDNAIVGLGLALSDQRWAPPRILTALHDVAAGMRDLRLPELFCGMPRGHAPVPVQYPVSCVPQAWAAGAFFMLLQATAGFLPDAPQGCLHVRDPRLPPFLRELTVAGLRIGDSRVTMRLTREGDRTVAQLLDVVGPVHVAIELH
jgi:glycogen debranching enzyme